MKGVMSSRRDEVWRKTSRKAGGMEFMDRLYVNKACDRRIMANAMQRQDLLLPKKGGMKCRPYIR
jgi:hypothetical protein